MSTGLSVWIALPSFCTSQMVENRQLVDGILLQVSMIRVVPLFQFIVVALFFSANLFGCFYTIVSVIQNWRKWLTIAKSLIRLGLMKPSQISSKMFWWHFFMPEFATLQWTRWEEWPYPLLVKWQDRLFHYLLPKPDTANSLPRVAQEWEQLDNLVQKTLNSYLLSPLTEITEEYTKLPKKIDLQTTDLEDYFNFSGMIELRLFYDAKHDWLHLRILNRGDRLLLTCPTSIVRGSCDSANNHAAHCKCRYFTQILCDVDQRNQELLHKNLTFLRSLWDKILLRTDLSKNKDSILSETTSKKLYALVRPEIIWMNSMTKEFQTATFVVDDILFTSELRQETTMHLQFVGVE